MVVEIGPVADTLYLGMDGTGVPVRDRGSISYSAAIESAAMLDTDKHLSAFAQRVREQIVDAWLGDAGMSGR